MPELNNPAGQEPEGNENPTPPSNEDPQGAAAPTGHEDPAGGQEPNEAGKPGEEDAAERLRIVEANLQRANEEAAARRVELRELKEKLQGKSPEEISEALESYENKLIEQDRALHRERAARRFNLPDEVIDRLRGDSEEEILADAKALANFFAPKAPTPPTPPDPSGGRNPRTPSNDDPDELWKKAKSVSDY